ncbi:DNA glycosylase [Astrocystis sublimbata]|nr:DNA glycosylase [Astrocystis sublimbata]
MSFSMRTDQWAAADHQANQLSDDFMFGFNVEDAEGREYLAEVAKYRTGNEADIKHFLRLSLLRGTEEWEQAVCCATAMRDRASFPNPLDGQDILTFLARIHGVEGSCYALDQSLVQGTSSPTSKEDSKEGCALAKQETQREAQTLKKRRARLVKSSPFWEDTIEPIHKSAVPTKIKATTTNRSRKALTEGKGHPEGADLANVVISAEPTEKACSELAWEGFKPKFDTSNDQQESRGITPFVNSQETIRQPDDSFAEAPAGHPGSDPAKCRLDTSPKECLDAAIQPRIEFERPSEQADIGANHASSDIEQKLPHKKTLVKREAKSPYFVTVKIAPPTPPTILTPPSPSSLTKGPNKRPPRGTVSALPFPRLDSPCFGLIQEELATDPFRLLIAVTFLIRTKGTAAIPVFRTLMEKYPTPADLAAVETADIVARIKHLGLGAVRAAAIQKYARMWLETPPRKGVRYAVKGYAEDPNPTEEGDGVMGALACEDLTTPSTMTIATTGWEIGHLTQGPYALDSWRIFCRDVLRGVAEDWKGKGRDGTFQPEWMRVLPSDKELRACLRWMWMREGWLWDPVTGDKAVLPADLRRAVQHGRVGWDELGNLRILDEAVS